MTPQRDPGPTRTQGVGAKDVTEAIVAAKIALMQFQHEGRPGPDSEKLSVEVFGFLDQAWLHAVHMQRAKEIGR